MVTQHGCQPVGDQRGPVDFDLFAAQQWNVQQPVDDRRLQSVRAGAAAQGRDVVRVGAVSGVSVNKLEVT